MSPAIRMPVASLSLLIAAATLSACAKPPEPRFVRAAELGTMGPLSPEQPLVIEFQEGDTIPLHFTLDGPFVRSPEGAAPIPLRVVRHFFLRLDKNGVKASADGKSFDEKPVAPGQFQFGVGADKSGVSARISIRTPTPAGVAR